MDLQAFTGFVNHELSGRQDLNRVSTAYAIATPAQPIDNRRGS
jgi:hypothetical protein